jgi:hypothetical protein
MNPIIHPRADHSADRRAAPPGRPRPHGLGRHPSRRARTKNGSARAPACTVTVFARLVITVLGARSPQREPQ